MSLHSTNYYGTDLKSFVLFQRNYFFSQFYFMMKKREMMNFRTQFYSILYHYEGIAHYNLLFTGFQGIL